MKRDARLRGLSRDHHHSLVLARFIGALCTRNGLDADVVSLVKERFASEITPHFAVEERLLSLLEGRGVDDLVERTRDEHASILRLLEAVTTDEPSRVGELGEMLIAHVRFEERELYPACEERLGDDELDLIATAHARGH